jgi:HTH-type transcriptional regulator, quorum sensing regulator NprR
MVGEVIHYYRIQNGLTQEQLSKGICSVSYLSKLENNKIEPSDEIIELLFQRLNVPNRQLFQDNQSLSQLLSEWCDSILARNCNKATKLKNLLLSYEKELHTVSLSIRFKLFNLGYLLLLNDIKQARSVLEELKNLNRFYDPEHAYYFHQFSGLYYYLENQLKSCLDHLKQALCIGEKHELVNPELYYQLALVFTRLFQIPQSIHYAKEALTLFDNISNYLRSSDCKILLGINFIRLQQYKEAEFYLTSTLKFAEQNQNNHIMAIALHNLGFLYSSKNEHATALSYFRNSLSSRPKEDYKRYVNTIYFIAKEYNNLGQVKEAKKWLRKGLEIANEHQLIFYQIKLTYLKYILKEGDSGSFINFIEQEALPYFLNNDDYFHISQYAEKLAELYSQRFQYKKSSQYLKLSIEYRKKMNGVLIEL